MYGTKYFLIFFKAWSFYIKVGAIFWTVILAYFFGGEDFLLDLSVEHKNELDKVRFLWDNSFDRWEATQVLESLEIEELIIIRNKFDDFVSSSSRSWEVVFYDLFSLVLIIKQSIHLLLIFLLCIVSDHFILLILCWIIHLIACI